MSGVAQGRLLPSSGLGVTPGGAQETLWGAGAQTESAVCDTSVSLLSCYSGQICLHGDSPSGVGGQRGASPRDPGMVPHLWGTVFLSFVGGTWEIRVRTPGTTADGIRAQGRLSPGLLSTPRSCTPRGRPQSDCWP